MKKISLLLLLMCVLVSACAKEGTGSVVGTWKLTAYGPKDAPTPAVIDSEAALTFDDQGGVTGSGGCNSLGGAYEVDGDQITFRDVTSTLMACDDARMAQESAVSQVLSGTAEYEIHGHTLTLTNGDISLVFTAQ